ncbi:MAG: FxLYD domain-containing protein [Dehalococcoidia bacterium]
MKGVLRMALLIAPMLLIAATCVTDTRQRGPAGPWVGEVVNHGSEPMNVVRVEGSIVDATGLVIDTAVPVCPATLLPGERGSFEIFAPDGVTPPLRAEIISAVSGWPGDPQLIGDGLTMHVIDQDPVRRFALVELQNLSASTYQYVTVCGNLRSPSGALLEVGSADIYPAPMKPGETRTLPIFFNTMPAGTLEFFARGAPYCCSGLVTLDPAIVRVNATRVVDTPNGRLLEAVGELDNRTGIDLGGVTLQAALRASPADRSSQTLIGCQGVVAAGERAPVSFSIPLPPAATAHDVDIVGVQAVTNTSAIYRPVVSDIRRTAGEVSATLANPTSSWLATIGICFNLLDHDGRIIGTVDDPQAHHLAPYSTVRVSARVSAFGAVSSVDVTAYATTTTAPILGP